MFEEYWDSLEAQLAVALIAIVVVVAAVAVFLVIKLVRKHRQVNRPDTPFPVKFSYYASIAYTIFPVDLLPDPLLIDDVGVLLGTLWYVGRALRTRRPPEVGPGHPDVTGPQGVRRPERDRGTPE